LTGDDERRLTIDSLIALAFVLRAGSSSRADARDAIFPTPGRVMNIDSLREKKSIS